MARQDLVLQDAWTTNQSSEVTRRPSLSLRPLRPGKFRSLQRAAFSQAQLAASGFNASLVTNRRFKDDIFDSCTPAARNIAR